MLVEKETVLDDFEATLKAYQPLLRHLVGRLVYVGEREDAMQVATIALYEAYRRFDPKKGSFGGFAKRTVEGHLRHYVEKEKRIADRFRLLAPPKEEDEDERIEEMAADDSHLHTERSLELREIFRGLTEKEERTIRGLFYEGFSLTEIARMEGVSHATVSTWKRRGLAKLRKEWSPCHD